MKPFYFTVGVGKEKYIENTLLSTETQDPAFPHAKDVAYFGPKSAPWDFNATAEPAGTSSASFQGSQCFEQDPAWYEGTGMTWVPGV